MQIVRNQAGDVHSDLILVELIAMNGQLGKTVVEDLPLIEEFLEALIGGFGYTTGGKVADSAFDFSKGYLKKDNSGDLM